MGYNVIVIISLMSIILVIFSFFNEKVLKMPSEIGLMTIAFSISSVLLIMHYLGVGFVGHTDNITQFFDLHDIIMNGLICFLLFSGSAKIKFKDLVDDKYLISSLAFFSTLTAAIVYGIIIYYLSGFIGVNLNILESCMVGSIIAPTDPVSAMSILKKAGMSRRISIIMEGESLFNDGIAVAIFVTFNEMNKSTVQTEPLLTFFQTITYNVAGAIILGLFVSVPLFIIFKLTKQKHLEILISFAAVTSAYALSEYFKVSAPIAAVVVGIYFATKMNTLHGDNEGYYTNFYAFWGVIDKTLNGVLYIIIGFAILYLHSTNNFLIIMVTAIVIGLISRYVSLIVPIRLFSRNTKILPEKYVSDIRKKEFWAMTNLLTWGGLKGGISIALALGTAHAVSQDIYNFIVISTYSVVAFSILVQGLSIRGLYRRLMVNFVDEENR